MNNDDNGLRMMMMMFEKYTRKEERIECLFHVVFVFAAVAAVRQPMKMAPKGVKKAGAKVGGPKVVRKTKTKLTICLVPCCDFGVLHLCL
jgi:hypothetical protein